MLIVSSREKSAQNLVQLLNPPTLCQTILVKTAAEARQVLIEREIDIVLINSPLSDEFGHKLAVSASNDFAAGVMLFVKNDLAEDIFSKVGENGVFVMPKPINKLFFIQALGLIMASGKRAVSLTQENIKLQTKIDEIRMVDRAKCVLIQYLNMTETQAHRYIEKQAMNMCMTKKQIAQSILKTYEN